MFSLGTRTDWEPRPLDVASSGLAPARCSSSQRIAPHSAEGAVDSSHARGSPTTINAPPSEGAIDRRSARVGPISLLLGWVALLGAASPVVAECTGFDSWPSFREAARTADRIVVGEVVEAYSLDSADLVLRFKLRVVEVLRGRSGPVIEFSEPVKSGAPIKRCTDSILRVHVGDVIAFAFDARIAESSGPVLTVAWIRGAPDRFSMPGVERLTLKDVRMLAGAPATDTADPRDIPARTVPVAPLLVAGLLGALAFLLRSRQADGSGLTTSWRERGR